jgi:hypothetical protein
MSRGALDYGCLRNDLNCIKISDHRVIVLVFLTKIGFSLPSSNSVKVSMFINLGKIFETLSPSLSRPRPTHYMAATVVANLVHEAIHMTSSNCIGSGFKGPLSVRMPKVFSFASCIWIFKMGEVLMTSLDVETANCVLTKDPK